MSTYQTKILNALKYGAKLQCTEGAKYKTWLVYPDGTREIVRRNSAEKFCVDYERSLIFGEVDGIRWRNH